MGLSVALQAPFWNSLNLRGFIAYPRRWIMADNKTKRGGSDRKRVAGGEGYEVSYFARKHKISAEQARTLIARIGNDREKLNAAASKLQNA
jgi:hypothetical protein